MRRASDILAWAVATFGPIAAERTERGARLVEEAIEAAQACGVSIQQVQRIAERAYSRPVGALNKEIGQVGMTLEALAEVSGLDVDQEIEREWQRVQAIPAEHWAKRHAEKVAQGTAGL